MNRILLHVCCAPCATHPLEVLKSEGLVIGYFDNPNIGVEEEYRKRLEEARRLFREKGLELIEAPYDPAGWYDAVRGLENEPEGGRRCEVCFFERLNRAAMTARRLGCDSFTTTLTVSRHKKSRVIHRIGNEIAGRVGVPFREDDFKRQGGYDRSIELSKMWGFYRQDYCGCVYSLRDRDKAKKSHAT